MPNPTELLDESQEGLTGLMKDIADAGDLLDGEHYGEFADQMLLVSVRASGLAMAGAYLDR